MGRRNRTEIEYKGAVYHIIIKGIENVEIFNDDVDRNKFLKLLKEMSISYTVQVLFYVLMNTHCHLLLKTKKANLSQTMQFLNSSYAHWFNYRHIRKGHLFQDRYKSYLVLNPQYLFSVASYISLNPVEAGLVNSPEQFRWGSFRYFTLPQDTPRWLKIVEFLELCEITVDKFINFVKENTIKKSKNIETILNLYEINLNQNNLPKNIDNILTKANTYLGDTKNNKNMRNLLIYILVKEGYRIKEISDSFHITRQSILNISKKIENNLKTDPIYGFWLKNIKTYVFS